MIFKCNCGTQMVYGTTSTNCYKLTAAERATGGTCMLLPDGNVQWLCSTCATKARDLAEKLAEIVGTKDVHIPSLLRN